MTPCPSCPRKYRPIPGDGPQPADILIIGERPGQSENKYGRVFIGKTGEELNQTYLPLANLHREDVRICNAVLCWADQNRTPGEREIQDCSRHHLPQEIQDTNPSLIILMGGSACSLVPGLRLDTHHGIPQYGRLFDYQGWIAPFYHPALGLHESRWMTQLLADWTNLNSEWSQALNSFTALTYDTHYELITGKEILDVPLSSTIAVDTESHGPTPFSVQVSSFPSLAYMVLATDRPTLDLLGTRLRSAEGIFHHAVHDLDELQAMGLSVYSYRDTVQEAYHQGDLPQALKPLVYRLFRHTMTSWEDVVWPHSIDALTYWMVEALEIAQLDLSLVEVKKLKTKVRETVKKGPFESLLNRLLLHTHISSDYDPWERLDEFWSADSHEWMTTHIESRLGRYPILGIANAPLHRAIQYACGDADWTGQVADELERRRQSPYWTIAPTDRD